MNIKNFIEQHALLSYFIITFFISWGSVILILGPSRIIGTPQEREDLLYILVFPLLLGPTIASLTLTTILYDKSGLKKLGSRLTTWKVKPQWYLIALLLAPILGFSTLMLLLSTSEVYRPAILTTDNKIALIIVAFIIGLSAGIFEETGWTGFAIPELRKHYDVFTSGLILGFMWGIWHYIQAIWGSGNDAGTFTMSLFLPLITFYVAVLPAYRIIMVWVYEHTKSLLIAMIMHASLTGNVIYMLLSPDLSADRMALLTWYLVFALPLWLIVGFLIVIERRKTLSKTEKAVFV